MEKQKKSFTFIRNLPQQFGRNTMMTMSIITIVITLAFIGGYTYNYFKNKDRFDAHEEFVELEDKTDELIVQGETDKAIKAVQTYINKPPIAELRPDAYIILAIAYENAGKYKEAIKAYEDSLKFGGDENQAILVGIARSAQQSGDKEKAIEYYKKVIKFEENRQKKIPSSDPNQFQSKYDVEQYTLILEELEK